MSRKPTQFVSLTELAKDTGVIGQLLRNMPNSDRLLRKADQSPAPWKHLLTTLSKAPKPYQQLFAAGQSREDAWDLIAQWRLRVATSEGSWADDARRAVKSGDQDEMKRTGDHILAAYWNFDHGKLLMREVEKKYSSEVAAEIRKRLEDYGRRMRKRYGRAATEPAKRPVEFDRSTVAARIALELTVGWMRDGVGGLGYCFFGDQALADFLKHRWNWRGELHMDTLRKVRQQLGLRKARTLVYKVPPPDSAKLKLLDRRGLLVQSFNL